jgi:hypothetical protein
VGEGLSTHPAGISNLRELNQRELVQQQRQAVRQTIAALAISRSTAL